MSLLTQLSPDVQAGLRRLQNGDWMAEAPAESIRLAATRPHGLLNRLYTPDASDVALDNPKRDEAIQ